MMKFYNRTTEIQELKRIQERAFNSRSRMTVITGRRRIGKTSLALRADTMLCLEPFGTETLKEIMRDHRPHYSNDDLLALYAITGGVPKYLELLCEDTDLSVDSILNYVVRENSPFIGEGRNLLIEAFGKDYGLYFSVLNCIAHGQNTQSEIEVALGGISVAVEVKRQRKNFKPELLKAKVEHLKAKVLSGYTIEEKVLCLDDM